MSKSVKIWVSEFSFIVDEDFHSAILVQIQDTSLTGFPHPRAAADLFHLVEPEGEDHGVPGSAVYVQEEEINSSYWHREPSSVNIQPAAEVHIWLRQTVYHVDNYKEIMLRYEDQL